MAVVGIFFGTLILWLFVSIDWPSLLCILMIGILANFSPYLLLCILLIWAILQTNFLSNMVTATVVTTVALPIILASSISGTLNIAIICACLIGMLSGFAFVKPPSMPHIKIASSSEWSNAKHFLLYGTILAVFAFILSISFGYVIGLAIF